MISLRRHYKRRSARRVIVLAVIAVLLTTTIVSTYAVTSSSAEQGQLYTVEQVETGLRVHPTTWVGQTIRVRGRLVQDTLGMTWHGTVLVSSVPRAPLARWLPPLRWQFDAPTSPPSLLLLGNVPTSSISWTYVVTSVLARIPLISHFVAPPRSDSWSDRSYRIRLLPPSHCPTSIVVPCPAGIVVS